jgi:hypothetical protein
VANSRFHNLLTERVRIVISEFSETVVGGQAKDYAEYRDACGYIRGLYDALKLCEDIESDMNQ